MKFAIVVFPGSNGDEDAYHAARDVLGQQAEYIWHKDADLKGADVVILPGGVAHGGALRPGAIARFSPVMRAVERFAARGGPVLGICNGFQVLLEAGLLPGAMLRNQGLRFLCRQVHIRVERTDTPFTCAAEPGQVLEIPVAHMDGNYFCESGTLAELESNNQIIFHYVTPDGHDAAPGDREANPNGSLQAIAGICSRERNVLGLMPHPERAVESPLGSADGLVILRSMVQTLAGKTVKNPEHAPQNIPAAVRV